MPRTHTDDHAKVSVQVPGASYRQYLVVRDNGAWHITFDGDEYGPYASEREAMLFAIDAAHTLGQQGQFTQVLRLDENGDRQRIWTSGQDAYPSQY